MGASVFHDRGGYKIKLLLLHRQSAGEFLDHKEVDVEPKKYECHHSENDDFIESIRSLENHQYHHHDGPDPYEGSDFFSISP